MSRMDIKGLARNVIPFPSVQKKEEAKAKSKLDADNEKEGNGQAAGDGDRRRRNLTPEEVTEAISFLENLPGVKDNNLTIRRESNDGITVVYICDRDGKVVRRIPESELSTLNTSKDKKSGHLLNKAL
ncbi:MAG: flagellar protein FlaG [Bdellovibrionota bacterium]